MIRTAARTLAALIGLACLISSATAQSNSKTKAYTLHGTIQEVKDADKKVTVKHDKIEGYMGAMTMDYGVSDPEMFKKLKAGDEIVATIYQDEYTLYNIRLVQIDDRVHGVKRK
ncbi:MAG: copper-binding protein [Bryobacterales bacterium]|nr:copper-binding protein [Bryobacterales bacterium]MBV9402079.1 copper-binding protein [Bryobacterales bacterium]